MHHSLESQVSISHYNPQTQQRIRLQRVLSIKWLPCMAGFLTPVLRNIPIMWRSRRWLVWVSIIGQKVGQKIGMVARRLATWRRGKWTYVIEISLHGLRKGREAQTIMAVRTQLRVRHGGCEDSDHMRKGRWMHCANTTVPGWARDRNVGMIMAARTCLIKGGRLWIVVRTLIVWTGRRTHHANAILARLTRDGKVDTIVAAWTWLTEREIMDSCEDSESMDRKVNALH